MHAMSDTRKRISYFCYTEPGTATEHLAGLRRVLMPKKMSAIILGIVLGQVIGASLAQVNCPDIAANPPGSPLDVLKTAGIWYEYTYRNGPIGNDPPATNVMINVTILGPRPSYPTGSSYYVTWIYNFFVLFPTQAAPLQCASMPQVGNLSSDGTRAVTVQIGGPMAPLRKLTYISLFSDYNLVQLWYTCNATNPDGIRCDQPFFWTYTRIKPPLLTADQKKYIEDLANKYFPQICRSYKDMDPTTWDLYTSFPTCNTGANNTPPLSPAFLAVISNVTMTSR